MAFWSANFWSANFWSADYWSESAAIPDYSQGVAVEFLLTPAGVQDSITVWTQTGDASFTASFEATQTLEYSLYGQVSDVVVVFAPAGTQTTGAIAYTQTSDAVFVTDFTSLQFEGLVQYGSVTVVFAPDGVQLTGEVQLSQVSDVVFGTDPLSLQIRLFPYSGLQAQATVTDVLGYPLTSSLTLAPVQNVTNEEFFVFLVTSKDPAWLKEEGLAGQPIFLDVKLNGAVTVSVSLANSAFQIDASHGAVYTNIRAALAAKSLPVTLSAYERFNGYTLANELEGTATVMVRGYPTNPMGVFG